MPHILIVDDVAAMRDQYAYDLRRLAGHETTTAASGEAALEVARREPIDCILLDLEMPGLDGFGVLRELQRATIQAPVIVYTGTGNYDRCVRAIKLGAVGFIDKSEPMERVVREIDSALERRRLVDEVGALKRRLGDDSPLLGESPAMQALKGAIGRLAAIPSAVLVTGESGCGKELVARELHRLSPRAGGPFLPVNCAALPENLVESELFGHEAGAFTGAARLRKGAFESAVGGTLFLDEIGELPQPAQAKLLRVLEDLRVVRLGGGREIQVDVRVVAATNRDLEQEITAGRFREDLYYRLNVHILRVPPLRERLADIELLVGHWLQETARRFGQRPKRVEPAVIARLRQHDWRRNNVRELRNAVERMVIACEGETIGPASLPAELCGAGADEIDLQDASAGPGTFKARKEAAEREIVAEALARNDGQIGRTAAELGLSDHSSLLKIMRRLGIRRTE